jgi:hypothetical protein
VCHHAPSAWVARRRLQRRGRRDREWRLGHREPDDLGITALHTAFVLTERSTHLASHRGPNVGADADTADQRAPDVSAHQDRFAVGTPLVQLATRDLVKPTGYHHDGALADPLLGGPVLTDG